MPRDYGRLKHDEDGGRQREGKGINLGEPGATLRSRGFGRGLNRKDAMRCPRCKTTGHTRFIQIPNDAFLKEAEEEWRLELVCTKCRDEIRGEPPDTNFPNVIISPDVSGYQPGIAKYPGDPDAYVTGKWDLDKGCRLLSYHF